MPAVESIEVVFLVLLSVVAAITIAARRIGIPYPILMVIGGLAVGLAPGIPRVELNPDTVLLIFSRRWTRRRSSTRPFGARCSPPSGSQSWTCATAA